MREIIPEDIIEKNIHLIREQKVMLDKDLAALYEVETKRLKRAVKRNIDRFNEDFMFQLTMDESSEHSRYQSGTLKRGHNIKYLPYVFTENGVAMLSSILNSKRAIHVNIQIMRAFTKLRTLMASHKELRTKIESMEKKYDEQFHVVFEAIKQLLESPKKQRRQIGFGREKE